MAKQSLTPFSFLVLFFLHCTTALAQSPAQAPAQTPPSAPPQAQPQPPAPSGPISITGILDKAGQFTTLIRLLRSTQVEDTIYKQLNNSNQGVTLFAPTDNAFGNLTTGTLNSLTDPQKIELLSFHVLQTYVPDSQFQTLSNPILTLAGAKSRLPLNVTTTGTQVNITTGIVNATVGAKVYSDGLLAIYQVDQVLLPIDIFGPPATASTPALAPSKAAGKAPSSNAPPASDATSTSSATILIQSVPNVIVFVVSVITAFGTMS